MKDTRWRTWEIIGLFWTLAAGNLLHFVYDWTGSSVAAALFSAVNESTWEHMKLLAVPWILFSLVEYIVLRSGGIAGPRAVGLLVGLAAIPLLFYGYKGIVGQGNMIVDILIFQVSVLLSFWVSWSLQKRRRLSGAGWTVLGLLVLLGVWALFLLFTFRAPDLAVFVDPLTGMREIKLRNLPHDSFGRPKAARFILTPPGEYCII